MKRLGRLLTIDEGSESPYVPGRSLRWLKVKQPAYREKERGSTSRRRRTGYFTADFYQIFTRRGLTHGPP